MKNFSMEWENSYSSNEFTNKNEYPSLEIVAFLMRSYGTLTDRSKVNVLDLGCGWGNNLSFLRDKGFSYSGIDFSESAINHCKKSHQNVYCGDFKNLPFENESFDVVFDRMAVQHNPINSISTIFKEVHRVLKPGGKFYSILVEKADYSYSTTYLNSSQIRELAHEFSEIQIDYTKQTFNGGNRLIISNQLLAVK